MKHRNFIIAIIILSICILKGYFFSRKYVSDEVNGSYTLSILSKKDASDEKVSYYVGIMQDEKSILFRDKFILNIYKGCYGKNKIDITKYMDLRYGDVIKVEGKINIPKLLNNPGEFNYSKYLWSNNIYGNINVYNKVEKLPSENSCIIKMYNKVVDYKTLLYNKLINGMSEDNCELAKALILGDKTNLDEETKQDFKEVGATYLMSASGSNISSLLVILTGIFSILKLSQKKSLKIFKTSLVIFFIVIFILLTGFTLSRIRACIMVIVTILTKDSKKKKAKLFLLFITLCAILLISPFAMYNLGFVISFLACMGTSLLYTPIIKLFNRKHNLNNICKNKIIRWILIHLLQNILLTLSIQLLILPIEISCFNSLPLGIFLSNILFSIIRIPINIIGNLYLLLAYIPYLSNILIMLLNICITILMYIIEKVKLFSFPLITMSLPLFINVWYYLLVIFLWFSIKIKTLNMNKKGNKNFKITKEWRIIQYIRIILFITFLITVLGYTHYMKYLSSYVYFFNVEQGDMSYIKCKEEGIIIDIGSLRTRSCFKCY